MSERTGIFVTLEGGEGVGKSTAAAGLADLLRAEGFEIVLTREPGGTEGAEAVRGLLLGSEVKLDPLAQTLLHFAARVDHVEAVIRPALARGAVVVCDRFYDSTMAYQAYGQGVDVTHVASLVRLVNLVPDVTFMLEVPAAVAKARLQKRGRADDRYERLGADAMARIALGFRAIAASEPGRCAMLDGTLPTGALLERMRAVIRERTGR